MKSFLARKSYLRFPEGSDPLLPILSLMLLLLPILLGHVSFADLRISEVEIPPARDTSSEAAGNRTGGVLFFIRLGTNDHTTSAVEEDTGRSLSSLRLISGITAPSTVKAEFRRLQRKYDGLNTILIQTQPEVAYEAFLGVIAALQAPVPDSVPPYQSPRVVVIPSGGL